MRLGRRRGVRLVCALVGVVVTAAGCAPVASESAQGESSASSVVPMPDPGSMQQVIGPAKEFVVLNQLQGVNGRFSWVACGDRNEALYSGEVTVSFLVPKDIPKDRYLNGIAFMMVSHGWSDRPTDGGGPSTTLLHTNEVRAEISAGTIRVSGECRNTNDHRDDSGPIDITARLTQR